jgi:Arc/MetJ-type ribon-helix-helix transcriptional regulator
MDKKNQTDPDEKSKSNLATFKFTREFVDLIDDIIENSELHFESRAEVVRTAVRDYYESLKNRKLMKEKKNVI